ncbi:hypothetical protein FO440_18505 [Mucilaginibacter corticis]|uniref:YCII-related domain-containing protein n=1 Tax=Mucilaginibacter corticis TaxID=2597670 RepID=A0A556MIJ2_9SPHI|nr:YciI family protein [Mucilaginibacter corticis]TSJ39730.1 hypothetical protein FO440_18505 [Mucilaginibacter corticis]
MKKFIVLFREPDGRTEEHSPEFERQHRQHWEEWFSQWRTSGKLAGGDALTLEGRLLTGNGNLVQNNIHRVGSEIIGGFLLLNATDLDEATAITASCPIYEAGGYAELREFQHNF